MGQNGTFILLVKIHNGKAILENGSEGSCKVKRIHT
jgi:hypothetical protein